MPACPSCGADFSGGGACPHCGAKTPSLDVPDLDLSSVTGPMSAQPPRVEPRKNSGAMAAVTMTNDDVLADDADEASFELAVGPGDVGLPPHMSTPPTSIPNPSFRPSPNSVSNPPASGGRTSSGSMPRVSAPPRENSRPDIRVSQPPVEDSPRVDPLEARAFADYGEPPSGALQSPIYAFRVKMRQSELRRGLWRAKIAFERAQKDQSRALADPSRLDEVKSRLAADVEAKERDVDRHEAALLAFDARALKLGTQITYVLAVLLFVIVFVPVFFRMCIGVDAPPLPQ